MGGGGGGEEDPTDMSMPDRNAAKQKLVAN